MPKILPQTLNIHVDLHIKGKTVDPVDCRMELECPSGDHVAAEKCLETCIFTENGLGRGSVLERLDDGDEVT